MDGKIEVVSPFVRMKLATVDPFVEIVVLEQAHHWLQTFEIGMTGNLAASSRNG